ncbi:hypothetical protein AVEN_42178-1 [Araneus ventricosus]|uniref:Uncharacterized protein n=1 Tax=Araneus ventricosus TaxID=182803 RepID=A0A4Y2B1G6_ARAVE|nr:hypothetical protein AVEN_42178-1 [Araneus ventricosus]
MTKTTPSSPNFRITPAGGRLTHVRFDVHQSHVHCGSSGHCDHELHGLCWSKVGHSPSICPSLFEGLLSRLLPFSAHKIWWVIHRSDYAFSTGGQPDPLGYCASHSPVFKTVNTRPNFQRLTPTHTLPPPFCDFSLL